jgi:hypothetical protein
MTFSMYQSIRNVPKDLEEATQSFHLSSWQRFWRLGTDKSPRLLKEVKCCISMSGKPQRLSPMAATLPHKVTAHCARAAYFLGLYSGTCSPPNMKLIPRLSRIKR